MPPKSSCGREIGCEVGREARSLARRAPGVGISALGTREPYEPRTSPWTFVLTVFVLSRIFFLAVGALAVRLLPMAEPAGDPLEPAGFLNYWAHWDGAWFSEIATRGYAGHAPESAAFFPLYPALISLGTRLGGGPAVWGVGLSLLFTLFALYFVYEVSRDLAGRRTARYATLALALFPTAFFLNAAYSEAPFIALTAGCVWAARVRRDFLLAGLLGALAAATRNLGVLLVIPLLLEWWRLRRELGVRGFIGVCLVPSGLVAYTAFLWARFGDPLVAVSQQGDYWGRSLTSPITTAGHAWQTAVEGADFWLHPAALFLDPSSAPSLAASNALNLVALLFVLILVGIGFFVLPSGLSIYTAILTLLPILTPTPSFPLMSLPRFALGAFPLFIVLGLLLSGAPSKRKSSRRTSGPRAGAVVWFAASVVIGALLTALFVTWRWVA